MKKLLIGVLLITAFASVGSAQTLKELLYSGKLKSDSGTVVRKTDDLSTKIDTATKKKTADSVVVKKTNIVTDATAGADIDTAKKEGMLVTDAPKTGAPEVKTTSEIIRDNNKIFKDYMDTVISTINTEVLPEKKIKKGTYYGSVDYEISAEGEVTVKNIVLSPESTVLLEQLKDRVSAAPPHLTPITGSNGAPRKTTRKYNFTITKG